MVGTRRLDIQGLRALAVLLVVAYHAGLPLPGGFVGVDVFFVISGFVITAMLLRELRADGRVDLLRFYSRRIKRLLPALSLVIAFAVVVSVLVPSPLGQPQETVKTAIGAILFSANIVIQRSVAGYFVLSAKDNALLHTWSLAVEEQFYLVFPALLTAIWLVARNQSRAATTCKLTLAFLGMLSFGLVLALPRGVAFPGVSGNEQSFVFFSAVTRAWEFVGGALVALMAPRPTPRIAVAWLWVGTGLGSITLASVVLNDQIPFPDWRALLPVCGAMLAIVGGSRVCDSSNNPLTVTPLVRVGDWSYSWYLWHWPVIVFAVQVFGRSATVTLLAGAASLLPAVLSFELVERPMRESSRITTRGSYTVLVACVAATLVIALCAERAVHFGWGQPWSMGAHSAMQRDCDSQPIDFQACTWGAEGEAQSVLLAGDSQSWAVADGVIAAASRLGMSTTVAPTNGCPFIAPEVAVRAVGRACSDSIERTLDYIRETHPTVLMIANSEAYPGPAIRDGYEVLLRELSCPRPQVVILRQPPGGDEYSGKQSILVRLGPPSRSRADSRPDRLLTETLAALGSAIQVLDPRDTLCSRGVCSVAINGEELYSNGNHLSVRGAMILEPQLVRALESVVAKRR